MTETKWIVVPGRPIPKPRMTRQDKYLERPPVVAYRHYANNIREAYLKRRLEIGRFDPCHPVALGFVFRIAGGQGDIKNWIAGVEDALTGYALADDNWRVVRSYFRAEVQEVDCNVCDCAYGKNWKRLKKPKCKQRECPRQETRIGFRALEKGEI